MDEDVVVSDISELPDGFTGDFIIKNGDNQSSWVALGNGEIAKDRG